MNTLWRPRPRLERIKDRAIWGTPDVVGARLRELAASCGVEEVAMLTTVHDPEARRMSYTLMAREFGLGAPDVSAARHAAD